MLSCAAQLSTASSGALRLRLAAAEVDDGLALLPQLRRGLVELQGGRRLDGPRELTDAHGSFLFWRARDRPAVERLRHLEGYALLESSRRANRLRRNEAFEPAAAAAAVENPSGRLVHRAQAGRPAGAPWAVSAAPGPPGRERHPAARSVALEDGLAQGHLAMAVREGGERRRGREVALRDVAVERPEVLLEGVGVALGVPAGDGGRRPRGAGEDRGVAQSAARSARRGGRSRAPPETRCSRRGRPSPPRSRSAGSSCDPRSPATPRASPGPRQRSAAGWRRSPRS